MDTKEAIYILKKKKECFDMEGINCEMEEYHYDCKKCQEAIDIAIEALLKTTNEIGSCMDCRYGFIDIDDYPCSICERDPETMMRSHWKPEELGHV